jgi:hypothetical protein
MHFPHHPHTMAFADNLKQLPSIAHIAELQLFDKQGQLVTTIPNAPGKIGSLTIYHALYAKHGRIDTNAAEEGLALFAEHTADAEAHPGSHPNIDRLLEVIASGQDYAVTLITKPDTPAA